MRLIFEAIALVWRVARRELVVAAAIQVAAAAAVTVQLLLIRDVLGLLVPAHGHSADLAAILPSLIPLVAMTALIAFATTAQLEQTLLIGELVGRQACADVAAVAAAVDLEAFERPGFHDRLERAHFNAANRNMTAVSSLLGLLGAMLSAIGVLVALIAVEPAIAPLTVVAIVPAWVISLRNSGRLHAFQTEMTAL